MRSALSALLACLLVSACGKEEPTAPRSLELLSFELDESVFSQDFTRLILVHPKLVPERLVEIYEVDHDLYSPIDRRGVTIEPGKLIIADPERYWRDAKIRCPFVRIVVTVYPG